MNSSGISAAIAAVEQEFQLLLNLNTLLIAATQSLASCEPQIVPQISEQISVATQELTVLYQQVARFPESPEARVKRRELLLEIRRKTGFCRAILRRWRRSIMVRQQLLEMRTEPLAYPAGFGRLQEI